MDNGKQKRSLSPEKVRAAQRLHQAVMHLWKTEDSVTLMSYGIAALMEQRHQIGISQEAVLKIMNKTLEIGSTSPEALAWQEMMRWRMDTMQKAIARIPELAIAEEDRVLLWQAITGQQELAEGGTIDATNLADHPGSTAG